MKTTPTLRSRFRGCIAGSWVGSAMGAAVEGWSQERIEREFGTLERLLPYRHYATDWQRPPGTTEDGIERQKLVATAIIEKRDRISPQDLRAVWLRDLDPEKMAYKQEPFDRSLVALARAGVPAEQLGSFWPFPNVVSVARATHPIGLINAGDPESAADDTLAVGKLYNEPGVPALRWAALYNGCVAEACRPEATVESVVATARQLVHFRAEPDTPVAHYARVERDLEFALEVASRHDDPLAMREEFARRFHGGGYVTYGGSQANEIVSKGLAVFVASRGQPRMAIVAAVNFGRDTDCLAAVAGGLAGTLAGVEAIPAEWLTQVNDATRQDPYTNNHRTIEETADGLLEAFRARTERLRRYLGEMADPDHLT